MPSVHITGLIALIVVVLALLAKAITAIEWITRVRDFDESLKARIRRTHA